MRSPTEISMSSSRGSGRVETRCARSISSSVVSPIAEITATTRLPASRAATMRRATAFSFSGSATELPPNFITIVLPCGATSGRASAGTDSNSVAAITRL